MSLAEYTLDGQGRINASNNPFRLYAFMDMTAQAEALFQFLEKTVGTELVEELNFLESYDRTKSAIQRIVDLPDQKIDLFIRFCLQNKGRLSTRKRASHFDMLTDEEIASMEDALQVAYRYRKKENHSHPTHGGSFGG